MLKKILWLILIIVISFTLSIIAYASCLETIEAVKVQYPIIVDGEHIDENILRVSIEDRIYLPIRAICEVFGSEIEWNEKGIVEITTNKADVEKLSIDMGFYGLEGWTVVDSIDFELSEETAIAIADDVFSQIQNEDFVDKTTVGIRETEDKRYYVVFRYQENLDVNGDDLSVIIRKSDGKIVKIVLGE